MKRIFLVYLILGKVFLYSQNLSMSLTACYGLDNTTNEPINNLTASLSAVTATVDRFNNPNSAFLLGGSTSSYIYLPNSPLLKPSNALSFSAWVKFNSTNDQYIVFAQNTCSAFHEGYVLQGYNSGGFRLTAVKSGGGCSPSTQIVLVGNTVLSINTWYHVGMYVGNDSLKIYLNGLPDGAMASSVVLNYNSFQYVYLGGSGVSFNLPLNGTIDNVRFYNRKISNNEFNLLYTTDPACVTTSTPAAAINCDGLNDFISLPNANSVFDVSSTHKKTFQVSFKNSSIQGQNVRIFSTGSSGNPSTTGLWLGYPTNSNFLKFELNDGSGGSQTITGNTSIRGDSTWHQASAVLDGTLATLYLDGNIQGTVNISSEGAINSAGAVHIGNSYDNETGSYFEGAIDELRVWDRALCQNEIQATKNCELFGSEPTLAAYYKFNQGIAAGNNSTVTTLIDATTNSNNGTLSNFALNGVPSNWYAPGTVTSGQTCTLTFAGDITATASQTLICAGSSVTLTASGGTSYTWQPGNLTVASVVVNPTVTTTYTLSGTNSFGCISTATITITVVTGGPNLTAQANPSSVCPGNSSTLIATGATSYTWLPGNLNGSSVVVNPASATVYTVFGSNGGCSGTATVAVNIGMQLNVSSSGNLCNNNTVDLYVSPTSTYFVQWSGPGIMGSSTNPTVTVNAGGTYSVAVTDTVTGCSGNAVITVASSLTPLSLNVTPSFTQACYPGGQPVTILASTSANYNWYPSSEVTPNTGPLVSVSPSVTTTYTVVGTLGSCSGSAVITISVNQTPILGVPLLSPICRGAILTLFTTGAIEYVWQPGNLSGPTVTVSPMFSTDYTVTGSIGICSSTVAIPVIVLPVPHVTATANPSVICIGNTSNLSATGALTYDWQIMDPSPSTLAVSPTVTTTYTVVGTDSLGCQGTTVVKVNVVNSLAIGVNATSTLICTGETVTLSASGGNGYDWFPYYIQGSVIAVAPSASTNYTVVSGFGFCNYNTILITVQDCANTSLGITNAVSSPEIYNGNFYKIKFTITAVNSSTTSPLTGVTLNDDLNATFPYPTTFSIMSQPVVSPANSALSINPLFNGHTELSLTSPSTSTLLINKRDTVSFTVLLDPHGFAGTLKNSVVGSALDKNNITVTDSSNNGFLWDPDNDGDPTNNNEISLLEIPLIELFIPEGFSPNSDGNNDFFVIKGLNNRPVKLTVFNRWGNMVYEKNNYDNSWDGTANKGVAFGNGKLPQGPYYYIFQFLDGKKETKTGYLVLWY
jgi:gliding motility-associated-like protein